jgi:hypothetical protein
MTLLSPHFTVAELTRSEAAARRGLDNTPPPDAIVNLRALCEKVLEPLRVAIGKPLRVNSGYRGPEANAAVGGRVESDERKRRTASGRACARAHLERSHAHKRLELRPHGVGQRRVLDHGAECGRRGAGAAAGAGATAALPNKATARTCARRLRPRPPLRGCGRTHLDEARGKMTAQRRPTPPPTITTSYIVRRNR